MTPFARLAQPLAAKASLVTASLALTVAVCVPGAVFTQAPGSITGRVTALADGAPIADATVTVYDLAPRSSGSTIRTDASGAFSFKTLAAGTYNVRVSAPGFVSELYDRIPCVAADCIGDGFTSGVIGSPVVLAASGAATVDVALDRGGTISGTVRVAPGNAPAYGARVLLYNASTSLVASVTTTALEGNYTFTGLPFGSYFARTQTDRTFSTASWVDELYGGTVCPSYSTAACRVELGTPIIVSAQAPAATADFQLDYGGSIVGILTVEGRLPQSPFVPSEAQGVIPALYVGDVQVATTSMSPPGGFSFFGLSPGAYRVRTVAPAGSVLVDKWYGDVCIGCGPGRPVLVTAGVQTRNVDIDLDKKSGGISGILNLAPLPAGAGLTVPAIQIYSAGGTLVKSLTPVLTSYSSTTGGSVAWSVTGLPAGTYYARTASVTRVSTAGTRTGQLITSVSGYWVDSLYGNIVCATADCLPTSGAPIVVQVGATTGGVNIGLPQGGTLTGAVPAAAFPGNVQIEVYDSRGVLLPGRAAAGLNGGTSYVATGLSAGSYYLRLRREQFGRFPESLYSDLPCDGCSVTSGIPVTIGLGEQKPGIDFHALPAQAVRGVVRANSSTPLSTITVEVFAANGTLVASAVTTADGAYAVPGLNPGQYYLRTANQRGYADRLYDNLTCGECDPVRGTPVTVAAGADTTGIDFTLAPGTLISGVVKTAGDVAPPLTGVGVSLFTPSGVQVARAVTAASGRYEATLPAGSYRAATEPRAGYSQKLYADLVCPRGICDIPAGSPITVGASPVENIDFRLASCGGGSVSPPSLASAAVGRTYRQALSAFGGAGGGNPRFTIADGALPPGLVLDANTGVLSATPFASGAYTFTVAATDDIGCSASRTYLLDVPSCTFDAPSTITAPAAGDAMLLGQSCTSDWTVASDAAWIAVGRSSLVGPGGLSTSAASITILPNGAAAARRGTVTLGSKAIPVFQSGTAKAPPFGVLETPSDNAIVAGSIAVSGWALDDLGVTRVAIYRDPVQGEGDTQVYLGDATMVNGARPDVEAAYPAYATKARAGWGYLLLTNMLPGGGNRPFRLYAHAEDADGNRVMLGTRGIDARNSSSTAPFGAIDTPQQGETISGDRYINWGWVLTPLPKLIPFDGTTVDVVIDGVPLGKLSGYDLARSDVSALFPGLKNSGGPVGYRAIDTTALSEGMHTIAWVVTDDAAQATGVGSRYFTVQNSAWVPSAAGVTLPPAIMDAELERADTTTSLPARIDGVDTGRRAASLAAMPIDADAEQSVAITKLQRLELPLARPRQDDACDAGYEGYLVVNGELRALPVGASLDPKGTFYWQPGVGFFGTYRFVFVRTSCDGARTRIPVTITIR